MTLQQHAIDAEIAHWQGQARKWGRMAMDWTAIARKTGESRSLTDRIYCQTAAANCARRARELAGIEDQAPNSEAAS